MRSCSAASPIAGCATTSISSLPPRQFVRLVSRLTVLHTPSFVQHESNGLSAEAFKTKNIEGAIQLDWPTIAAKNAEWNERFNKEVVAFVK